MAPPRPSFNIASNHAALIVCAAAMISLAIAMGVGRFAFTPLLPLMIRDGLLGNEAGALLATSNYLGYFIGAMLAARIKTTSEMLLAIGLLSIVAATAAVGWTSSVQAWTILRFIAGVMSAWVLVATSAWSLGWLAFTGRPNLAGIIFAGVGLGITAAGIFCLVVARPETPSLSMWIDLGGLAAIAMLIPLAVSWLFPVPMAKPARPDESETIIHKPGRTVGLIICYSLFGLGYILPATYLPALARQLIDDPQIFGLAWPVFGLAALISTLAVARWLKNANRLHVWAASHILMAIGVVLPAVWSSLVSVLIAAMLVGSTFMVITMVGIQEASARTPGNATSILGKMTTGMAFGQLSGPVLPALFARITPNYSTAMNIALALSAAGLLLSALYLLNEGRHHRTH